MDLPVNICATGCICAAGENTETCFETILNGQSSPTYDKIFPYNQDMSSSVFAVKKNWINIDNPTGLLTDTARLLLTATQESLAQADLTSNILKDFIIGSCIGSSTGASLNFKSFYQEWRDNRDPDLTTIHSYINSNPAAMLAEYFSFDGPVQTVTNACSSGTDAIGIGASWIRQGLCDLVIAGGADALSGISYTGFSRLMITSPKPCRPFDKNRQGLNLGEGAAILILASDDAVERLRQHPIARVMGYGTCCDAHHLTAPHPEGLGLKAAISDALTRSNLTADDIDFINIHGTGTDTNDRVEAKVIAETFPKTPFTGIKGCTGHTLGAAGAIEAVMTVKSLSSGQLMPTTGFSYMDPELAIKPVSKQTEINAKYALSDSLAFGGNNSAIIFERQERE